jgi:hypothetical protein
MFKSLFFLTFLAACTAKEVSAIDDFIEGEATTAEKIVQDLSTPDPVKGKQRPRAEIRIPVKKF